MSSKSTAAIPWWFRQSRKWLPKGQRIRVKKMIVQHPAASKYVYSLLHTPVYLSSIFKSKTAGKKFVVFSQGRTGSTLLVDLLNSHPEIYCDNEILQYRVLFPRQFAKGSSLASQKRVYGMRLKRTHLVRGQAIEDPRQFFLDLVNDGWKIIYLKRHNFIRQAVSAIYAVENRSLRHVKKTDENQDLGRIRIDCQTLLDIARARERNLREDEAILKDIPHATVIYEDDLLRAEDHQRILNTLFDFLEVPHAEVRTIFAKTGKDKLSDLIQNFDEVVQFVEGTEYAKLLHENQHSDADDNSHPAPTRPAAFNEIPEYR